MNNFDSVVLGRGVAGIKGNNYIYTYLQKLFIEEYWSKISSGSTFQAVNSKDLKEVSLVLPSSVKEQEKK